MGRGRKDIPVEKLPDQKKDNSFINDMLGVAGIDYTREHLEIAKKALRHVIAEKLTDRQREAIYLRYYEGLRQCEIARRLGVNPSTVTRLLQHAQKRIKDYMQFYIDYARFAIGEDDEP